MKLPIIKRLELGPMANFTYLLADPFTKECAVIDPGWEVKEIIKEAESAGLKITKVLLTHTHFDHARQASSLAEKTGTKIFVHPTESSGFEKSFVKEINEGDVVKVGELELKVLHTPGHSAGSVCFLICNVAFTGDTLFVDGIGRTDLEGGDDSQMFHSLARLCQLKDDIVIYPGHGYGDKPCATIGEQKKTNPYLKF